MERLMTVKDVALYMQLTEQTIQRYVLNRTIPFHKIKRVIRFRLAEIEKWIDNGGCSGTVTAEPEDDGGGDLFAGLEEAETEAGQE